MLQNVTCFKNLVVIFDSRVKFSLHIEFSVNKAKSVVDFVKKWTKDF